MPNTFLTVQEIAQESLQRLRNNLVFAQLVHRDFSDSYSNVGDTIQVKKPAVFTAADFVAAGTTAAQDVTETNVLVTLDKIADVTVDITAKELSLNIQDFGDQVVEGAVQALAQKIDADIAALIADVTSASGDPLYNISSLSDIALARKTLNEQKAPMNNRRLVMDPEAEANLLVLDAVINAEKSGTTDALRDASIGRLLGFDTFMSQNVETDGTLGVLNAAFHRDAIAFVNRPMAMPMGGANGYVVNYDGISIRVTMGYDMSAKKNTISFDVLYGAAILEQSMITRALGQA